jgi:hypothetical protein
MDQRSICLALAMEGLSSGDVHNEFVVMLSPDAVAYSTITRYLRQEHCQVSFDAFDKQPFSSLRELAKLTRIPTTLVHQHLTKSLGIVVKHPFWIPRNSTKSQHAQLPSRSHLTNRSPCDGS